MCGIAGWFGSSQNDGLAESIASSLNHRGPDAKGIQSWPGATFIHTRLSIIDLSSTGAQPMCNEDGTVWVIFNGEIYNHAQLRHLLKTRGHRFRGTSDTEILPHLYEEEGAAFLPKLRGMFTIAIYDTRQQTFLLARDRFGIKPLFYAETAQRLAFASEIRPLLLLPEIDKHPNTQAIFDFSALFYIPAPQTFYRGICALQPGELITGQVEAGQIRCRIEKFHRWQLTSDPNLTLEQAAERADVLLQQAVASQLESDVPLGALLSGGIDSSLVSAAAQQASSSDLNTFNVRFSEAAYDETWAAVAVAIQIGSRHHTLDMQHSQGNWEHITALLRHTGQPFADTSLFAVDAVSHLIRQHVTVALSGDGGDEGFGGYSRFWRLYSMAPLQRLPFPLWRGIWNGAAAGLSVGAKFKLLPDQFPKRVRDMSESKDSTFIVQNLFTALHVHEHHHLWNHAHDVLPIRRLFEPQWLTPQEGTFLDRLSRHVAEVNTRLEMVDDFLFKVDIGSMRQSLEVRVPMLDEDLFTFGLNLPHSLKATRRAGKVVLRTLAKRRLPPEVARKPKMGFAVPVGSWVTADFKRNLREVLLGTSPIAEYLNPEAYSPLVKAFCEDRPYPGIASDGLYRRMIMLLALHLALEN